MGSIYVTILLATYNGARFLKEQLDSILQQTHANWEMLISDDASADGTLPVINEYVALYHPKIRLLPRVGENVGSVANFSRLFEAAKASGAAYIMFCDQDDAWHPFKIAITLDKMLAEEAKRGSGTPLLIHTNFTYADAGLKPIPGKAGFHARKLRHLYLANLLIQNPVYGCTMLFNRSLLDKVRYIPSFAENHDFWVALVASAFGEIIYLPQSTMLYRQHGGNISTQHDNNRISSRIKRILIEKKNIRDVVRKKEMVGGFARIYAAELSMQQQELVAGFLAFLDTHRPSLAIVNLRRGVRMQTAGQTALFYITAMLRR